MSTFDDRRDNFERKFAHDEAIMFKATARRAKLLGLWAAEVLGKPAGERDAYARSVVQADLEEAGDEDLFRKIRADFDAAGIAKTDHQIRKKMSEFLDDAVGQIMAE